MRRMAFDATVRRYLRAMQREYEAAIRGGQHTAELSFRNPLHELFINLAHDLNPTAGIDVILEPRNQGRMGRPDWRIQKLSENRNWQNLSAKYGQTNFPGHYKSMHTADKHLYFSLFCHKKQ